MITGRCRLDIPAALFGNRGVGALPTSVREPMTSNFSRSTMTGRIAPQARRRALPDPGFTLLELLVVMVIIGLLAAYVGPRYFAQLGKSERGTAKSQVEAFGRALDAYRLDTGHYPSTPQGLAALYARPGDEPKWNGPYLQKAPPADPWGQPYQYRQPGTGDAEFDLLSFGKDGRQGGEGDNADIGYR